jgi:membrane protein DedA with SNARE-associated domain
MISWVRPRYLKMLLDRSHSSVAVVLIFCITLLAALSLATQSAVSASSSAWDERSPAELEEHQSAAVRHFRRTLARMQPLIKRYGYWAAVGATLVEGMGIPAPGQTLLIAGAFEAAHGRMNIALLLLLVTGGAIVGNSLGYGIGRWGGRAVLHKLKVNPQRQQYLDDLFKRRGGPIILLARFVDGLRQLNGIISGVMKMPWWIFTAYNVGGALLWTFAWGLGTYYLGRDIRFIAAFFHRHRAFLFALSVTALLVLLVYFFSPKNRALDDDA